MKSLFDYSIAKVAAVTLLACTVSMYSFADEVPVKEVSAEVKHTFEKNFPKAEAVNWVESEGHYIVYFTLFATKTVANIDKDGNIVSILRYYKEDHLPMNVSAILNRRYADKKIAGVTEYTVGEEVAYYLTLEDAKHWYTVKISGSEMQLIEKLRKA